MPLRHRSTLSVVGRIVPARDQAIEEETPLFAAERAFAWERGGPLTRAFVAALPDAWGEGVLVGHHESTWDDPRFQRMVVAGIRWAMGEDGLSG